MPLESLPVLVVVFVVVPVELLPVAAPASVTPTISPMVRATAPAAMPAPAYPARIRTLGWGRLAPGVHSDHIGRARITGVSAHHQARPKS